MAEKISVLFRVDVDVENEREVCAQYFDTVNYRSQVPDNSLVVARYSCLPYFKELETELALKGSRLINTFREHQYVANLTSWAGPYGVLAKYTPRTWTDWSNLPADKSFVVKGQTNSRKHEWSSRMFCPTREDVPVVAMRLLDDALIREQGLVVREYVPLKKLGEGLNGLPISNEWRTFWVSDGEKAVSVATGFYWGGSFPEAESSASIPMKVFVEFVQKAADLIAPHATFFVLDVAETAAGDWVVIEVNDGMMSGLNGMDPDEFYYSLHKVLTKVALSG